jgi:hypothetical protein
MGRVAALALTIQEIFNAKTQRRKAFEVFLVKSFRSPFGEWMFWIDVFLFCYSHSASLPLCALALNSQCVDTA